MRLIDTDALLEVDPDVLDDCGVYGNTWGYSRARINNAQTVDAIPVVRCRECTVQDRMSIVLTAN